MMNATEIRELPLDQRANIINSLSPDEMEFLLYDWHFWARNDQIQPEDLGKDGKYIWLALAGRGWGKTRTFAEWVIDNVRNYGYRYVSLVGSVADEVRDIMIEGESGILSCSPPDFYPEYKPAIKRLIWPNGAIAKIFYGSEPDKSRGAQSDLIWMDEIIKWQYPEETFDNLIFGLRLGKNPLCGVSTTPRPTKFIKELVARDDCIVTRGKTYDNKDNLSGNFLSSIVKKYEGTRVGRQELEAQILDDNPNALWVRAWFEDCRESKSPDLDRIVVAVDPPASSTGAECGIVVVGVASTRETTKYYVLDDLSTTGRPEAWAKQVITAYNKYEADMIIGEKNNGGDMVESTIKNVDRLAPVKLVWASRGKATRAEPISLLYEKGQVHHVGTFCELEDQCCEWEPGDTSPDRMDALVWAITALMEKGNKYAEVLR